MAAKKKSQKKSNEPTIENRKARHNYFIEETLECGLKLKGTEIKAIRDGQASLAEGYVRAAENPLALMLHGVHISEYPPAGEHLQHNPTRTRILLAHSREIRKLADKTRQRGTTLIPLKIYFVRGKAKLLVGVGHGKRKADKRQDMLKRDAKREIDRAISKSRSR